MINFTPTPVTWQTPPAPIDQILNAPPPPVVVLSSQHEWLIELEQSALPAIAELAEPEIPLGGFRINPQTNGPARHSTFHSIGVRTLAPDAARVLELPQDARIGFVRLSPDEQQLAFTLTRDGLELWVVDLPDGTPRRLLGPVLNAAYGTPYRWLPNNLGLICKVIPDDRPAPPAEAQTPQGPLVQENLGRKTPTRTYTNLLGSPYDEALFEYYLTSALEHVALDGIRTLLVSPALIDTANPSPDGRFILLTTWQRPFSCQVPASLFPQRIEVLDQSGKLVHHLADQPLADDIDLKFDSVISGPRQIHWRPERPSTLYWTEALDDGDASRDAQVRDALFELSAPFTETTRIWQSQYRFRHILWGREDVALAWESWYDNRKVRIWQLNPSQPDAEPQLLFDRSFEDQYSDPGMPLTKPGPYGREVLRFSADGGAVYLEGRGATPDGVYPFLDRMELGTCKTERLWQAQDPYYEQIVDILDDDASRFITRRQSQAEPPNYFLHSSAGGQVQLTDYPDPSPQMVNIRKELVQYRRADGVQLSATLYLPSDYEPQNGPLPMIFWVYPAEFKDRATAGQVTTAKNTFSRPRGSSVLFLLTQGYAVLSNPSLPIVGEGEAEPNDSYVEQLVAGAEAAVDYVVKRGVADPERLVIGGHSYGAFTTANLLAHSRLFQAGIALSGAYNRTLTPFGFQGEQRSFWDAPETYIGMSPFTYAKNIKAPLLLIHGAADSNAGTYPIQTERFYEALKGLGATVRWVVLPLEDHGYRSREAVGHVLWEMIQWCEQYVKNKIERFQHDSSSLDSFKQ